MEKQTEANVINIVNILKIRGGVEPFYILTREQKVRLLNMVSMFLINDFCESANDTEIFSFFKESVEQLPLDLKRIVDEELEEMLSEHF